LIDTPLDFKQRKFVRASSVRAAEVRGPSNWVCAIGCEATTIGNLYNIVVGEPGIGKARSGREEKLILCRRREERLKAVRILAGNRSQWIDHCGPW
jgi:hypothetical protein